MHRLFIPNLVYVLLWRFKNIKMCFTTCLSQKERQQHAIRLCHCILSPLLFILERTTRKNTKWATRSKERKVVVKLHSVHYPIHYYYGSTTADLTTRMDGTYATGTSLRDIVRRMLIAACFIQHCV